MRTCFKSAWRLFRGRPDIITPGRYTWAVRTQPHYPYPHHFGSRDWTLQERDPWPELGETDGPRQWVNGAKMGPTPPPRVIGQRACLEDGATYPVPLPVVELAAGFDRRCFDGTDLLNEPYNLRVDVRQREHQRALSLLLCLFYTNPNLAGQQLQAFMGPGSTVLVTPNSQSYFPGTLIGHQGDVTILVISGSGNPQQLALQAFLSGQGPTSYVTYATSHLWNLAADHVHQRYVDSGASLTGPIILVGHSYGGAVAAILAARYRIFSPGRPIQLLTLGMPPPGDDALLAWLDQVVSWHIRNEGDPVPYLPPSGVLIDLLRWLVPANLLRGWGRWRWPLNSWGLSPAGVYTQNPDPGNIYAVVLAVVTDYLLGRPIAAFAAHSACETARRLGAITPVEDDVLSGTIIAWGNASTPAGYLRCDGALVSRTVYSDLFNTVGTTWRWGRRHDVRPAGSAWPRAPGRRFRADQPCPDRWPVRGRAGPPARPGRDPGPQPRCHRPYPPAQPGGLLGERSRAGGCAGGHERQHSHYQDGIRCHRHHDRQRWRGW